MLAYFRVRLAAGSTDTNNVQFEMYRAKEPISILSHVTTGENSQIVS